MLKRINAEIVLGALLASIFWSIVLGWQAAHAPTQHEKQACYEAAQKSGHKTEECKTFWERSTTDPVAVFTLVLAISTIGLWVATIALYLAGEKQVRFARENADRQFIETQKQNASALIGANAAKEAADAAIATERARFYVVIKHNFLRCIDAAAHWDGPIEQERRPLPIDMFPMAEIRFKNYGKTPGIVFEVATGIVYSETPPDPPVYDVKVINENMIAASDLTENFATIISGHITMAQAKRVRSGEASIWIFGYATYDDVFGKRQTHGFLQKLVRISDGYRFVLQPYDHKHYNYSS